MHDIALILFAEVAELADAYGSGPYGLTLLGVQLSSSAPYLYYPFPQALLRERLLST